MKSSNRLAFIVLAVVLGLAAGTAGAVDVVARDPARAHAGSEAPASASAADTLRAISPGHEAAGTDAPEAAARPILPALAPLVLDPSDLGLGSSVVFLHLPSVAEMNDLAYVPNVAHVVISLRDWPQDVNALQGLAQSPLPDGADLVVLLAGYPPSHAASEAWNYVKKPLRIVMVVDGPPAGSEMIYQMNAMRGLERVIADMAQPSRSGFTRLQRPLSFRVVRP